MPLNLSLAGLDVDAHFNFAQDESGLPEGAIGYVNFADGTYFFIDSSYALTDVLGTDAYFTDGIDPEDIIEGSGWSPQTRKNVALIGDAKSVLIDGFTAVVDLTFAGNADLTVDLLDLSEFDPYFELVLGAAASSTDSGISPDGTNTMTFFDPTKLPNGRHKVAVTMIDGKIAASLDGAAVIQQLAAWAHTPDSMGFGFQADTGAYLASVVYYPPQENAELPGLSAL